MGDLIVVLLVAASVALGVLIGADMSSSRLEQTAVEHGCMEYNSKDGTLEWVVPNP